MKKIIEELVPVVPTPPFHPCEARLKSYGYLTEEYKERRARSLKQTTDKNLCGRRSAYKLEGKCYCRVHAGQVALKILVEREI